MLCAASVAIQSTYCFRLKKSSQAYDKRPKESDEALAKEEDFTYFPLILLGSVIILKLFPDPPPHTHTHTAQRENQSLIPSTHVKSQI